MDNVVSMLFEELAEIIETSDLPPIRGRDASSWAMPDAWRDRISIRA
jgi:hypothetical protein